MSDHLNILEVNNLSIHYRSKQGFFCAAQSISFSIEQGKIFGLVGESGSGKSSVGKAILHLIPKSSGSIIFKGTSIHTMQPKTMQMIFQDPYSSLNPKMRIKEIIEEPLDIHKMNKTLRLHELLDWVYLPKTLLNKYPTELSGGQRQRVGIARALAVNPEFLFCDEPTSSLDAYHEHMIINLLQELQKELKITYLFVAHNLPLVASIAHEIGVMRKGQMVEKGCPKILLKSPQNPYTKALFESIPIPDPIEERERQATLGLR